MSEGLIVRRGGSGGGASWDNAVIHIYAPAGSVITASKGGATKPVREHIVIGQASEYLIYVTPADFGEWTINATHATQGTTSTSVDVERNIEYIVQISYRVPPEYQQVEYIEFTGTQYIDTGITPNNNTFQVNTKIEFRTASFDMVVFGGNGADHYHLTPYNNAWYVGLNGSETHGGSCIPAVGKQDVIVYNNSSHQVVIDENVIVSSGTYQSTAPITIGKRGYGGSLPHYRYFYFQFVNNSTDELILDLVPCYRRSDSVAGFYDTVDGTFFTNNGTGTFVVGGNV